MVGSKAVLKPESTAGSNIDEKVCRRGGVAIHLLLRVKGAQNPRRRTGGAVGAILMYLPAGSISMAVSRCCGCLGPL